MVLVWTLTATCLLAASSAATFLTMVHLRCRWDVHASSVRWLFWLFFSFVCLWCVMRTAFFVWMGSTPTRKLQLVVDDGGRAWTLSQLDRFGIHGVLYLRDARKAWIAAMLCAGDLALFAIALTLFPLTYELWRLARKSMDRGVAKERRQIRRYARALGAGVAAYAATQLVLCLVYGGYNKYSHRCLFGVYVVQFVGLAFMAGLLVTLKANGRKYETVHGTFVASPVYQRLKRIMLVFAVFSFQFQLSMMIVYFHSLTPDESHVIDFVGVSLLVYNATGLALSITTSCSQACIFSTCAPCLPEDFEAQFLHQRFTEPTDADLEAPRENPIFVYTDIESSSALWNANGAAMDAATELHDDILRSSLIKHRGYEITTVGDAFQVAFHTMGDAVEYCLDVQLQLLVAKWPKEIHGAIPATEKKRVGRRVVFNGLRVRMGIHDANEDEDGTLVQDVHVVTRKTTYTGVSEVIAEFVGDLGSGGQILMTNRVATWLKHHREDLSVDVFVEYLGEYTVPQVNATVEIYQVLPAMLAGRAEFFPVIEKDTAQARNSQRGGGETAMHGRATSSSSLVRGHSLVGLLLPVHELPSTPIGASTSSPTDSPSSPTESEFKPMHTPRQAQPQPLLNLQLTPVDLALAA